MADETLAADPDLDAAADANAGEAPSTEAGLRPRGPIMSVLHGYRLVADRFAGVLGAISAALIFPTVIISVANVILRRIGASVGQNLTSNALIEAQWYLYGLIFVFGFAYILRDGINVRVDFWFANRSSRTQSWIDLIGHLIALLPFAYIGIRYSWPSVELSWQQGEQSPDAGGLFRPPIKTALMAAFVFLVIQGLAEVIKNVEYLRGHEYRHEDDNPALAGGQTFSVEDFAVADTGFADAAEGETVDTETIDAVEGETTS
ncbi:MAG: TRAP transporter small permease subunit [Actinomycetota bacterium]